MCAQDGLKSNKGYFQFIFLLFDKIHKFVRNNSWCIKIQKQTYYLSSK